MIGVASIGESKKVVLHGRKKEIHLVAHGNQFGVLIHDLGSNTYTSPNCDGPGVFTALTIATAFTSGVAWTTRPTALVRLEAIASGRCPKLSLTQPATDECPCRGFCPT